LEDKLKGPVSPIPPSVSPIPYATPSPPAGSPVPPMEMPYQERASTPHDRSSTPIQHSDVPDEERGEEDASVYSSAEDLLDPILRSRRPNAKFTNTPVKAQVIIL
jgi:hypothetical protein